MANNLHIYETPEDTARAVAEMILKNVKEKNKQSIPFNIALSGGNTPKLLFTLLANEFSDRMLWHILRLFWVDERCVAPTHAESNFGMAYQSLLVNVPIPDANIFRMQGEANPEKEALRYQALLEKELPMQNGFPQFDLVLLGLGDDGHTASIFPDDMSLLQSELAVGVGVHPVSGQKRITLTGRTIRQAENVIFLVTGTSKAAILRQIIQRESVFENYPASHVYSKSGAADFYLDYAAAKDLEIKN